MAVSRVWGPISLAVFAERFLASCSYRGLFGAVTVTNTASLRLASQWGRPVYYVSYLRLLFYERLRVSKEFPKQLGEALK